MPTDPSDAEYMGLAIQASREALAAGDMPYGAALVSAGRELLQVSRNRQVSSGDCTAHAEVMVVREAGARLGLAALQGSTVYASGEPCAMCSGAMFWAGVRRVVYAVPADAMAELSGGDVLPIRCAQTLAGAVPSVRVDGPLRADDALLVLREAAARDQSE